jgi:hypothetical protein
MNACDYGHKPSAQSLTWSNVDGPILHSQISRFYFDIFKIVFISFHFSFFVVTILFLNVPFLFSGLYFVHNETIYCYW